MILSLEENTSLNKNSFLSFIHKNKGREQLWTPKSILLYLNTVSQPIFCNKADECVREGQSHKILLSGNVMFTMHCDNLGGKSGEGCFCPFALVLSVMIRPVMWQLLWRLLDMWESPGSWTIRDELWGRRLGPSSAEWAAKSGNAVKQAYNFSKEVQ